MNRRLLFASLSLAALALAACSQTAPLPELLEDRDNQPLSFADRDTCTECHAQHVAEWEMSNHAYAMKDPVFHAMVKVGQEQSEGALGQFCVQCHSPVALATEQTPIVFDEERDVFTQNTETTGAIAQRGVSCDVCHSITQVLEPRNARAVLTPDGVKRGTIEDPVPTSAHASEHSPLHGASELCSMCHAVVNPKGALIEETFSEWEASSAAAEGKQCQDCHMPSYVGRAAPDAPERTLHRHTFVGVDVSLLAPDEFPGYDEMRDLSAAMLRSAVTMETELVGSRELAITITNLAGHALPSGATAERQMWLEIMLVDEGGTTVFETGTLDVNGDIRDGVDDHSLAAGTDPQLTYYGQQLIRVPELNGLEGTDRQGMIENIESNCRTMADGAVAADSSLVPVAFPWQANWQCNYMIPPDGQDVATYDLSAVPAGTYTANVRLLFRTFPPYFLRKLVEMGGLDPAVIDRVPTVVMAETSLLLSF